MRHQLLRPPPTEAQMAVMYPLPHDHRIYGRGHHERVEATIDLARTLIDPALVVDLSCGNGEIARRLAQGNEPWLGDFAAGYTTQGLIEDTIELVGDGAAATWILSETLEHVVHPLRLLERIRDKAHWLVLSTPLEAWDDDNTEHLHAWDRESVEAMLAWAGWQVVDYDSLDTRAWDEPYLYGIWVCS